MKLYPIVKVIAGFPGRGKGSRAFYFYEREARNSFIREQVEIVGKENVAVELEKRI